MIYLYGLVSPDVEAGQIDLAALQGVTGPVRAVRLEQAWLIYGDAETDDILPKRRFMLAHTHVLETLLSVGTLLPMRFGMFTSSLENVASLLSVRSEALSERFQALEAKTEIGLRISFPRDEALTATLQQDPTLNSEHKRLARQSRPKHFEVAEFGRRLADALDRRRTETQRKLLASLAPEWRDHVLKSPESDVQVLAVDALIDAEAAERVAALAEQAAVELSAFAGGAEPQVRIIGPAPAFNFVKLSLGVSEQEAA